MNEHLDAPYLSHEALVALREHYEERRIQELTARSLGLSVEFDDNIIFPENWQLSQFWYDDLTRLLLARTINRSLPYQGRVALISCPTLFVPVKTEIEERQGEVTLLEFDRRFELYKPNFVFYDYNNPTEVPAELHHSFDMVVADPPFLSEECITKTAETIKLLVKNNESKIVVCTGSMMKNHVEKLLGLKMCEFKPTHENNLANEFSCYANFSFDGVISV